MVKTRNKHLQEKLIDWSNQIANALTCPGGSEERRGAILKFCNDFVPSDVTEDDISYFSGTLFDDEVRL